MKKLGLILTFIGLFLVTVFAGADFLGLGEDTGVGATQILGILAGVTIVLIGFGLVTIRWDKEIKIVKKQINLKKILDFPVLNWVLFTFLVAYVVFFLFPVFFSKFQIQYLTKYIPNAFVSNIGFDIEIIIRYIEGWLKTGSSPYADGIIAYPPLAVATLATLSILDYPAYFKFISSVTLLAYFVSSLIVSFFLIPKRNRMILMLLFISGLYSYGFQFEMERGQFNVISMTFCLLAIYIFHFHRKFRYFAYLFFSISIQLKVYPVFFVVMFIDNWRNLRSIIKRFIGLILLNIGLLFILGQKLFLDFLNTVINYQKLQSSRYENLSIKGFVYYLSNDILPVPQSNILASIATSEIVYWLVLGVCFLVVVRIAYIRNERGLNPYILLVCTIAALIIPSVSNDYKLSLLVAPMSLVICCFPEKMESNKKLPLVLLTIIATFAYWTTLYPATVKPDFLSRNFPALIVILLSVTAMQFLVPYTYKRINGTVTSINSRNE